jgi:rubrerythrin|tara:strand:+ start:1653 stop:1787 length:135 start_codon:yes stop_codon:yes gene_type:complete
MTYICEICGHEHVGESPPETCPACGALSESFHQDTKLLLNEDKK